MKMCDSCVLFSKPGAASEFTQDKFRNFFVSIPQWISVKKTKNNGQLVTVSEPVSGRNIAEMCAVRIPSWTEGKRKTENDVFVLLQPISEPLISNFAIFCIPIEPENRKTCNRLLLSEPILDSEQLITSFSIVTFFFDPQSISVKNQKITGNRYRNWYQTEASLKSVQINTPFNFERFRTKKTKKR